MTIPSLKATKLQTSGEVAVLNRWADRVKQAIEDLKVSVVKKEANIALKTNNVANQTQDTLNLKAGANITLTPDIFGAVTIAAAAGGSDGLVHGDAIHAIDPAYMVLREDFNNPSVFPGPPSSIQTWGSGLNWHILGGGTYVNFQGGAFPLNGVIAESNSASANAALFAELDNGSTGGGNGFPLFDYPGWKMIWVFQLLRNNSSSPATFSMANTSMYVGLANYIQTVSAGITTPRPPYFIGLRYDTDTTAPSINDSTFKFEYVTNFTTSPSTRVNTTGTVFDTTLTPTEGKIYRLEISCSIKGAIDFLLTDGSTVITHTMSISPLSFSDKQPSFSHPNGQVNITWATGTNLPIDLGTIVTISGGSISAGNGTFTHQIPRGVTGEVRFLSSITPSGTDTGATTSFYPALRPFIDFGNDSFASPVANSKGILIDFMSLVWNKGLAGGTTNSTLSRYF